MIDALLTALHAIAAAVGLMGPDIAQAGSWIAVAAAVASLAVVIIASVTSASAGSGRFSRIHPTRTDVQHASVAQSDPDAPGHILRRGPGRAIAAA